MKKNKNFRSSNEISLDDLLKGNYNIREIELAFENLKKDANSLYYPELDAETDFAFCIFSNLPFFYNGFTATTGIWKSINNLKNRFKNEKE